MKQINELVITNQFDVELSVSDLHLNQQDLVQISKSRAAEDFSCICRRNDLTVGDIS